MGVRGWVGVRGGSVSGVGVGVRRHGWYQGLGGCHGPWMVSVVGGVLGGVDGIRDWVGVRGVWVVSGVGWVLGGAGGIRGWVGVRGHGLYQGWVSGGSGGIRGGVGVRVCRWY